MKKILGTIKSGRNQVEKVELLSVNEMLVIRGGTDKPSSRPGKDIIDFDEQ